MTSDYFEVPGEPVAKGRPRFARAGDEVRTYTPAKTVRYEDTVRLFAQQAGVRLREGPVVLTVDAVWPMRGTPRKTGSRPAVPKTTKPDADNVAKIIMDSLQGIAFENDSQVVLLIVGKSYAAQGRVARTAVEIKDYLP